jgi:hypothetical protein
VSNNPYFLVYADDDTPIGVVKHRVPDHTAYKFIGLVPSVKWGQHYTDDFCVLENYIKINKMERSRLSSHVWSNFLSKCLELVESNTTT